MRYYSGAVFFISSKPAVLCRATAFNHLEGPNYHSFIEMIKRKAIEIYCFMLLGTRAVPQISDARPDMRQIASFVASSAACRWNRMLLARENVGSPLAAIVVATEHNARCASGCQPPSVEKGTGSRLNPVPAARSMPAYLEI